MLFQQIFLFVLISLVVADKRSSASRVLSCGQVSGTICLNERQYITCDPPVRGEPYKLFTCPLKEQRCGDVVGSCTTDLEAGVTKNTNCGVCSIGYGRGHTCTSMTTFRPCFDEQEQIGPQNSCPPDQICDANALDHANPCTPFTGRQLLCWRDLSEDVPSEPDLPESISLDEYACQEQGEGVFENSTDETCRTYLLCERADEPGAWRATRVQCPSQTLFAPGYNGCVPYALYECPRANNVYPQAVLEAQHSSRVRQNVF